MKNFKFFLFLPLLAFMFSCSSLLKKEVLIDNPTEMDMLVEIDGTNYEVEAYSSVSVELAKGEHAVVATQNEEEIFNETVSITGDGILNPSLMSYVVWKDLYLEDLEDYDTFATLALNNKDTEVNANVYEDVDFEVFENISFIEKNWDFDIETFWPDEVDLTSGSYVVKSKIYRLEDLEADWGFYGDFDFSDYTDEELNAFLDSLILMEGNLDSLEEEVELSEE